MIVDFFVKRPEVLIELIVGIVGFLGVIISLRADRKVKVAEFIANYNFAFLTTPEFTMVERKLAGCLDAYKKNRNENGWLESGKKRFETKCDKIFKTEGFLFDNTNNKFDDAGAITKEYQSIVNYLVYLESFATLIVQKRVRIKDIDDLFGYRFFIAVNNPVLQRNELIPYKQYYQGIVKAYKIWTKYYRINNIKFSIIKSKEKLIEEPLDAYSFQMQKTEESAEKILPLKTVAVHK